MPIKALEKNLSFDDIIKREPLILTDGGLETRDNSDWYKFEVYDSHNYSQIDYQATYNKAKFLEEFKNWWLEPSVLTSEKITEEIKRYLDDIREKLKYLNEEERNRPKRYKKKNLKVHYDNTENIRKPLEEVALLYNQIYQIAKKSVFKPNDPIKFACLENIVLTIAENSKAKRNFSFRYNNFDSKAKDLHADEELVASALYSSIVDKEGVCIVTGDSDINRLLLSVHCHLIHSGMYDINGYLLLALEENPIHIYFNTTWNALDYVLDTSKIRDSPPTNLSWELPEKQGYIKYMTREYLENGNLINHRRN